MSDVTLCLDKQNDGLDEIRGKTAKIITMLNEAEVGYATWIMMFGGAMDDLIEYWEKH